VAARLTGDELGPATDLRDLRALAKEYARQSLRGRIIVNRETGQPIEINWAGLKKAFSGTRGSDLLRILPGLPNMLEHGRYIGAMADQKMRRGIRAVHVFESAAELTGKRLDTILFVRETNDGRFFYDYGIKRGDTGMPGPGR
jgi:Large polyvalent protein-associated domain 3